MASVLVVDDDSTVRLFVRLALERHGHVVREAADGKSGLQNFLDQPSDLVITDIDLPGLNGLEMIAALRRWGTRVPVLAMSGCRSDSVVDMLYSSVLQGANSFLAKPFTAEEFTRLVSEMLALHGVSMRQFASEPAAENTPSRPDSISQG